MEKLTKWVGISHVGVSNHLRAACGTGHFDDVQYLDLCDVKFCKRCSRNLKLNERGSSNNVATTGEICRWKDDKRRVGEVGSGK